jgi:hypothetical protein
MHRKWQLLPGPSFDYPLCNVTLGAHLPGDLGLHPPREETVEAVDCSELLDSGCAEQYAPVGTSFAGWLGFQNACSPP